MEMIIRRFAGIFVLASLALGYWVSPYWYLFTAFVGVNLFQSSFTGFCPLEKILEKLGVGQAPPSSRGAPATRDPASR
ncbi:MAG TPA: DUF2892 domain-containing protein [Rhodothermales bacterium]|nr:DUF2892 domain-containing protein [Rhodothermales bacterium]